MNDTLFFIIILMVSPTQIDVIYNKVSIEEFKNHQLGTSHRKTYDNSASFFSAEEKDKRAFVGDNSSNELFIHVMDKPEGYLQKLTNGMPKVYTRIDVQILAKTDILGLDEFVRFAHKQHK